MYVIIVGPDRGLEVALAALGVDVARVTGAATAAALESADVESADLLVLTDVHEATAVPVARERRPGLRVVGYSPDALPEFVRGQVDVAVSPAVLDPEVVAEELAGVGRRRPD